MSFGWGTFELTPVIRSDEVASSDRAGDEGWVTPQRPARLTGKTGAVIGSGPAGLSCAYFLARLGYKPTIFEAETTPGGMLVQAIPAYRLPREELGREITMIEDMGVTIQTGKALGRDFTLQQLKDEGYEAVFLGVRDGLPVSLNGEELGLGDLIQRVAAIACRNGVGIMDNVEDRVVGLKVRDIYEVPAAEVILNAHKELEKLVFTGRQRRFKASIDSQWADLCYEGLWYEPLRTDIDLSLRHI